MVSSVQDSAPPDLRQRLAAYGFARSNGEKTIVFTSLRAFHGVLAEWIDSEVTHFQRKAGSN